MYFLFQSPDLAATHCYAFARYHRYLLFFEKLSSHSTQLRLIVCIAYLLCSAVNCLEKLNTCLRSYILSKTAFFFLIFYLGSVDAHVFYFVQFRFKLINIGREHSQNVFSNM